MSKKFWYWFLSILIGAILLYSILVATGIIDNSKKIKVVSELAAKRTLVESVSASGKIYPIKEVKISPDVSGEIIVLNVQEGDSVRKGQLLATINSSTYQSVVNRAQAQLNQSKSGVQNAQALQQQAQAQLNQAQSTYNRNKRLFEEKVISPAEFEIAEANYKSALASYQAAIASIKGNEFGVASAKANVNEARQQLGRTTIFAPMSGRVSALFVKKGERVVGTAQMAGTEMMRISDMSALKVDVEIGENDIVKISVGDSASIDVDAYGNRSFSGVVTQISSTNPNAGMTQAASSLTDQVTNYIVSISMNADSYADLLLEKKNVFPFRPGMSASVEIYTKKKDNILSVPIGAVTTRIDDKKTDQSYKEAIQEYVFIDSMGFAVQRAVKTGLQDNKYIEIKEGLKGNEKIITLPYEAVTRTLKNLLKIQAVKKEDLYQE